MYVHLYGEISKSFLWSMIDGEGNWIPSVRLRHHQGMKPVSGNITNCSYSSYQSRLDMIVRIATKTRWPPR